MDIKDVGIIIAECLHVTEQDFPTTFDRENLSMHD